MAFNNKITGPQDYQNFDHTNKDGNIWLCGDGKLIPLQMKLTEANHHNFPTRALGLNRNTTQDPPTP